MRSLLDTPSNVYTVADSSIFANVSLPTTEIYMFDILISNIWKVANIDEKYPVDSCNKKFPGEEWRCFFVANLADLLDSKIMFINSEYDPIGIEDTLNITCMKRGESGKTLKYCSEL